MDQLKANAKKSSSMVRKAAPITIGSIGYAKVNEKMEKICHKLQEKYKLLTH